MGDLSLEKVFLFVLVALPGLVAIRSYNLWLPSQHKDWKESLVDAVFYSAINFFAWAIIYPSAVRAFVEDVSKPGFNWDRVEGHFTNLFLYTLLTPVLMTAAWYRLRVSVLHRWCGMDHPYRTGWDWIVRSGGAFYVRFVLKRADEDGRPVELGGYYSRNSFASTYPEEPEIYVERLHPLDHDGRFQEAIEDSRGMVIKMSECERVEIMEDRGFAPWTWRGWERMQRARAHRFSLFCCVWVWRRCDRYDSRLTRWTGRRAADVARLLSKSWRSPPPIALGPAKPQTGVGHGRLEKATGQASRLGERGHPGG